MMDGIYSITFRGATDWGLGMLVLRSGQLTGADVGGVLYDGRYHEQAGSLIIEAELSSARRDFGSRHPCETPNLQSAVYCARTADRYPSINPDGFSVYTGFS
jgi:hypothetical protein